MKTCWYGISSTSVTEHAKVINNLLPICPDLLKHLQMLGLGVNLRTVVFLADVFLEIYPIAAPITDGDDDAVRAILDTTAIMAHEFKLGRIQSDTN